MSCLLEQVKGWFLLPTLSGPKHEGKRKLMYSKCDSRQRDSPESDKCPQRELEQHGGASPGRTGGLQGKTIVEISLSCMVFFSYLVCFLLTYTACI